MPRSFLLFLPAFLVVIGSSHTSAQLNSGIDIVLLGTPKSPGGGATESANMLPNAINARGEVAGTYMWCEEPEFGGCEHRWAFMWSRTRGFTVIAENAEALDINDQGQVVGHYWPCQPPMPEEGNPCDNPRGFLWSASRGFVDLGAMFPMAINNAGRIVGFCSDLAVSCLRTGRTVRKLPAGFSAEDLNERGVVAGLFQRRMPDGDIVFRPAVWMASTGVRELSSPLPRGRTHAINESSTLAGTGDDGRLSFAQVWTPFGGTAAPIGPGSSAYGISDRGWLVGLADSRPALWRVGERLTRLPTPVPAADGGAIDVNDAGEIIGAFTTQHGQRAVLWTVR
jgi:hypothetical protein